MIGGALCDVKGALIGDSSLGVCLRGPLITVIDKNGPIIFRRRR